MSQGSIKRQKQVQFKCPKQNHIGEDRNFAMSTPFVYKNFRFSYNKGTVGEKTETVTSHHFVIKLNK